MESPQLQIEIQTRELSSRSFEAFGEDIACMLGVEITGRETSSGFSILSALKKNFKKVIAIGAIKAEGTLDGTFYLLLDQEAFFTLAGTLVVQPEKVILQNRKHGSLDNAKEISDAIGEIGNLIIGSFDRIFREEGQGHGHFVFGKTSIVNSWNNALDVMELKDDSRILQISYEAKINEFPPIKYTVIYPESVLVAKPKEAFQETPVQNNSIEPQPVQDANVTEPVQVQDLVDKPAEPVVPNQPVPEDFVSEPAPVSESTDSVSEPAGTVSVFQAIQNMTQSPATLPGQDIASSVSIAQYLKTMPVSQIMNTVPAWASPDDTVEQVLAKMQQFDTDYVIVGSSGKIEGIASKLDVRGAMSPYLSGMFSQWKRPLDLATLQIRIKWVMTRPVHTISAQAPVSELVLKFAAMKLRALPVTGQDGLVVGIATTRELVNMLLKSC